MIIKQSCLTLVPFKLAIYIFPPNRLVQTAFYTPQSQLHLHSCNNELVNSGFIGGKGWEIGINTNGLRRQEARWAGFTAAWRASLNLNLFGCQWNPDPIRPPRLFSLHRFALSRWLRRGVEVGQTQLLKMDIYTFVEQDIAAMAK